MEENAGLSDICESPKTGLPPELGKPPETFFFEESFTNEEDAFTRYYLSIRENGYILKLLNEIENMGDYCDLFEVPKKYQTENINMFFTRISIPERSDKILFANNLVKLQNNDEKGRHLIVTKGVPRDKVLINEFPTVLQVNPLCTCVGMEHSVYRCHHCGFACTQFFICDGCNVCVFCSRLCLNTACNNYHTYECYGLQRHFWSMKETDYSYLAFRMMLYGANKAFFTDIQDSEKYGNISNNYPFLYKLETNFSQMSLPQINRILHKTVLTLLYLIKKTDFFGGFVDPSDSEDIQNYVGGLMVKHYCQAQMNNVIIKYPNYADMSYGLDRVSGSGKAICPTISLLNHSCSPNAVILFFCENIVVKSIKPITAGEEITVCYSEVNATLSLSERRLITEGILCFTCECSYCLFEKKSCEAPFKCPSCIVGNAKIMGEKNGHHFGFCFDCGKDVTMDDIYEKIKIANICCDIFQATSSLDSLTRLAEVYCDIFPLKSFYSLDVYKLLYEKVSSLGEKPLEVLKYGLLLFNIIEQCLSRLYLPVLASKLKFMMRFISMKKFSEVRQVTPEEKQTVQIFAGEVLKVRNDLLFYLSPCKIEFYEFIQIKVHNWYHNMTVIDPIRNRK